MQIMKKYWLIAIGSFFIAAAIVVGLNHILSLGTYEITVEAGGSSNLSLSVYYVENEFWENPLSSSSLFLRVFMDYIEIESRFSASFSRELDITYQYDAIKRFVIMHSGSVIFEEIIPVSHHAGQASGRSFSLNSEDYSPIGRYIIQPDEYFAVFEEFLDFHARQIELAGGEPPAGFRGFSADLFIDFTYSFNAASIGLGHSITRGYRIPLGLDVFHIETTGASAGFSAGVDLSEPGIELNVTLVIILAAMALAGSFGIYLGINKLMINPDPQKQLVNTILKKYNGEIVMSSNLMDLSAYTVLYVTDFEELLKISINSSKHIMGFRNPSVAMFCTISDNFAYIYDIKFNKQEKVFYIGEENNADEQTQI